MSHNASGGGLVFGAGTDCSMTHRCGYTFFDVAYSLYCRFAHTPAGVPGWALAG